VKKRTKSFLSAFVALIGFSVAVYGVTGGGVPIPTVTGVSIFPETVDVEKGERQRFTAGLVGIGNIPQGVTWTVEGEERWDTYICNEGILTVSPHENAETLTVRAISVLDTTVYETTTVTIVPPTPEGSISRQLARLRSFALDGGVYIVELSGGEDIASARAALPVGRENLTIILRGVGEPQALSLVGNGSLFSVGPGVTLVLDGNVTLKGAACNIASLVFVEPGGKLVMNAGARITGNTRADARGAGVNVHGAFTMNGGEIRGNVATREGGGVFVGPYGRFTMNGGRISDNTAAREGGGVFVAGIFVMYGGVISNNTASSHIWARGGGVMVGCLDNGLLVMRGGVISGNMAVSDTATWAGGGGVHVGGYRPGGGTLLMSDGVISDDNVSRFVGNMADLGSPLIAEGTAKARYGTFTGDTFAGTFTPLGDLSSADHTIEMLDGVLQGVLTITVTGIPVRYDNWARSISLWNGSCGWFGSITECINGSSATFSILADPGAYRVYFYVWNDDEWVEYAVRSRKLTAGDNTIPFGSFRN